MRVSTSTSSSTSSRTSLSSSVSKLTLSALFLTFPSVIAALNLDCKDVAASGKHFDFSPLGGPHQVYWLAEPESFHSLQDNFTFVLDLCKQLKGSGCHNGARVCGINNQINLNTNNITTEFRDIVGSYTTNNGRMIEPKYTLLRNSKSHADVGREGVRAELHGGKFPFEKGADQMAIIEFVCDKERTGLEGDEKGPEGNDKEGDDKKEEGGDKKEGEKRSRKREDNGKCENSDKSLRFCGYGMEDQEKGKQAGVLRLEWRTKYACENAEKEGSASSHWGFFTWFIIILFLAIAAYLIFGSWLNYNRYGARGWDLLPHGDAIRDIPYILKDFGRRVVSTVSGPGSRGGYSAV
ncbi:hypothetical protein GQ43DRAFT_454673 [Delitschia confertaspora ATCC 74209]|uniref:Autophagy-related protein 27 n=1 Tax=Delitschia confertaspora ATCC 74209 TaxID=1513339 RepID=A0A9P4JP16_9PLEO|nr:hypothetical protein GQ43DRAFT_454673 [Delitschia confertaspora ATCC 74209]